MANHNVTISLPEEVVREAKHAAVDQGLSLSKYVANILSQHLEKLSTYEQAREEERKLRERGFNLGLNDRIPWTRDELYER